MTILLRQLWEELLPWERTRWHWSKHVKFRPSWLFRKGCLSLHSCQTAILSHFGTLNSAYWALSTFQSAFISALALVVLSSSFTWQEPWANLGRILALACTTTEKHGWPVSTIACFRGRAFLGIPYSSPCVAKLNKSVWSETRMLSAIVGVLSRIDSDCCMTILLRQLWEELLPWERTRWHWSKHVKFRPSWLFRKGCLSLHSCQTAILSHVGTFNSAYWALSTFQSAYISALALVVLSSSFTWQEPWANLGRILAFACATTEKHGCPVSTFACFRGRAFLGIPYSSPCVAKLNKSVWSETRMLSAIVGVVFHG